MKREEANSIECNIVGVDPELDKLLQRHPFQQKLDEMNHLLKGIQFPNGPLLGRCKN